MTIRPTLSIAAAVLAVSPVTAQASDPPRHAIGADVGFSTDSDSTSVLRFGANFDWHYRSDNDYQGFRLERLRYRPNGDRTTSDERIYYRAAGGLSEDWRYLLNAGTDFDTVVGSASIHDEGPWRKELFVERDKVETPLGIENPIYFTYAGGTIDVPVGRDGQITALAGVQAFTGDNVRTHLRANAIYVVAPDSGLSLQLRSRYFRNSEPDEYDYYSPRWYAQLLPVIQLRRYSGGWRYLLAGGLGIERDSRSDWRQSRYLNLRVASPADRRGWAMTGEALYSNTPVTNSDSYDYVRASLGVTRIF